MEEKEYIKEYYDKIDNDIADSQYHQMLANHLLDDLFSGTGVSIDKINTWLSDSEEDYKLIRDNYKRRGVLAHMEMGYTSENRKDVEYILIDIYVVLAQLCSKIADIEMFVEAIAVTIQGFDLDLPTVSTSTISKDGTVDLKPDGSVKFAATFEVDDVATLRQQVINMIHVLDEGMTA